MKEDSKGTFPEQSHSRIAVAAILRGAKRPCVHETASRIEGFGVRASVSDMSCLENSEVSGARTYGGIGKNR